MSARFNKQASLQYHQLPHSLFCTPPRAEAAVWLHKNQWSKRMFHKNRSQTVKEFSFTQAAFLKGIGPDILFFCLFFFICLVLTKMWDKLNFSVEIDVTLMKHHRCLQHVMGLVVAASCQMGKNCRDGIRLCKPATRNLFKKPNTV